MWRWAVNAVGVRLVVAASVASGCVPEDPAPVWRLPVPADTTVGADATTAPGGADAVGPACRRALSGELVLNEVALRPGGLDLDGDGASTTRDEWVELVSRAPEPVSLAGASLWFGAERRGGVSDETCVAPREAVVIIGSTAAPWQPPSGALVFRLDRTLRLTDGGGPVSLKSMGGAPLAAAEIPAAVTPSTPAVWTRTRDGDWDAPWTAHAAPGWSPGRCADGHTFPCCLAWLDDAP